MGTLLRMRIRPETFAFTVFLGVLGGMTPLSMDMGLPALSSIGKSLNVTSGAAGLTLGIFLLGFAFGPVVLGPLSDRYGRRPVLLGGSFFFVLASVGCTLAPTLPLLLLFRFLAGIGGGAGATISLAIVRDLYDGIDARVRLSHVSMVGTLAPMMAPAIGAVVLGVEGWRYIYGLLSLMGVFVLVLVAVSFGETLAAPDFEAIQPRRLLANYARFFRHRICFGYAAMSSLNFACLFSYVSSAPLVVIGVFGVSPRTFGWTFASTAAGILAGAFANGKLNARAVSPFTLLAVGLGISLTSSVAILLLANSRSASLATMLPFLILNTFSAGFISPNANQGALHPLPDMAGLASAVLGASRTVTGAFASVLTSVFFDGHSARAMGTLMTIFATGSVLAYVGIVRPAERQEEAARGLALSDPAVE